MNWYSSPTPLQQTGLYSFNGWNALTWTVTAPGRYTFYFGADTLMDGTYVDSQGALQKSLYVSSVTVNAY